MIHRYQFLSTIAVRYIPPTTIIIDKFNQTWRVYGRHDYAPAVSINFTGWSFSRGTKHLGHPWSALSSSTLAAHSRKHYYAAGPISQWPTSIRVGDRQTNDFIYTICIIRLAYRMTAPLRKAPVRTGGLKCDAWRISKLLSRSCCTSV